MSDARQRGNRRTIPSSNDLPGSLLLRKTGARAAPRRLRELAGWYREFAERAGNPVIWEARLRTAEDLDAEADRLDRLPQD